MQKLLEAVGLKPAKAKEAETPDDFGSKTLQIPVFKGYDIQGNWLGYGDAPQPFYDYHVFEKQRWR